MRECAYRDCEQEFEPARHNQKYCNSECTKNEMNARAKDAYAEKRDRRNGKFRQCLECGNKLSKYNDDQVCGGCQQRQIKEEKDEVWLIING